MNKDKNIELLCPAGDEDALKAGIAAGADAIYFGTDLFNARINAKNFSEEKVKEAVLLCHAHNVKVYVTMNIAIFNKEMPSFMSTVGYLYESGVDALIVSDLGMATVIKEYYPDFELHASTQCTAHNLDGVNFLYNHGFKRVVTARELDRDNIRYITENTKAETEIFVHGAHCMSVSGQCLMSFAMGGRSGNRGECAQPCRLPYSIRGKTFYPLSLKDMSLCNHIPEIEKLNVSSLKIEGRMKSAEYVYNTVSVWRHILDKHKNATKDEIATLEGTFSRQGFTDGFFVSDINSKMLGIRSEKDKETTRNGTCIIPEVEKVPVSLFAEFIFGKKATLSIICGNKKGYAEADIINEAITSPTSEEDIKKSLSKFGQTPYTVSDISVKKSDNIMIRVSDLNNLRRSALQNLIGNNRKQNNTDYRIKAVKHNIKKIKSAFFSNPDSIPENSNYFDIVFVYADRYKKGCPANGICMPPVVFDSEWNEAEEYVRFAKECGVKYALISNIGQTERLKKYGFRLIADYRFNVFNSPCVGFLLNCGFENLILSPELSLPQLKDFHNECVIAYGRFPVMTTHKCIIKDTAGCEKCKTELKDRTNASMYCEGIFGHRNIIYNSVPVYMADRQQELSDLSMHFIFSDESRRECYNIIEAYKNKLPSNGKIRRIKQ